MRAMPLAPIPWKLLCALLSFVLESFALASDVA